MLRLLRPKPVRSVIDWGERTELIVGDAATALLDEMRTVRDLEGAADQRSWTRPWTVGRAALLGPLESCDPMDKPHTPGGTGFVTSGSLIWTDFCASSDTAAERFAAVRDLPAEYFEPEFLAHLQAEILALPAECVTTLDTSTPIDVPIFSPKCVGLEERACNDWRVSPYVTDFFAADIVSVAYALRKVVPPWRDTKTNVLHWVVEAEFMITFQDPRRF